MKTAQSILAAGMVLTAVVHSFGAPSISQQPADQSVSIGATVRNVVVASGLPPLRYEWRFQGDALGGATNSTLVLSNIQVSQAGGYDVVVSDSGGSITSRVARIEVDPTFTKITTGPPVTDMGSALGGSWGDYDGDGYPDLFVARANNGRSALYRNNGDGTFTSITNAPFAQTATLWLTGAWGDLDNDGHLDLVAPRWTEPTIVYFNNGDGTFSSLEVADASPASVAVLDYNQDGLLDVLLAGNWNWTAPMVSWLYRNNGDRTFTRMTSQDVGPIVDFAMGGAATCADYDDDGSVDVFCGNYAGQTKLFRNDGTGRFLSVTNVVFQSSVATGAWGDYDNDGRVDLCAASWGGTTFIYRNLGDGLFERAAIGQTIQGPYTLASWADYDNDGFLDLFLTSDERGSNALYHNDGDGTFTRIITGSIVTDVPANAPGSFVCLWFDYDNDGFLDLYALNNNSGGTAITSNFLYRNNGNGNAWLTVKLIGSVSNRDAVGAKVRVQARYAGQVRWQRRDISGGDAYNGNELYAHFGLGDATNAMTLRIEWPSGMVQELHDVATMQILTLTEPWLPSLVQPRRLEVPCGTNVTFSLNATGAVACTYQWLFNDLPLPDATNATLELTSVQTLQSGAYSAHVSDGTNSVTTRSALLRVWCGPVVTNQPTNLVVRLGLNATFRVGAESLCPSSVTYQWLFQSTNLPGATNAILTLTNVTLAQGGTYQAVLSDCSGSTVSETATLLVAVEPLIVQQPCSVSVPSGGSVTLSVAVTNTATLPILYRWRRGGQTLSNATFLLNERVSFLPLTNLLVTTNYNVVVSNAASTKSSGNAWVTVLVDDDGDGLPDQWEIDCGINQATPNHGRADDDGDGLSNGEEYQCGTDPTHALSYLKVESITLDGGQRAAVLRFFAVSNKTYTVQYCDGVGVGEWQRLTDVPASASDRVTEVLDPAVRTGESQRVYRLATPRAP